MELVKENGELTDVIEQLREDVMMAVGTTSICMNRVANVHKDCAHIHRFARARPIVVPACDLYKKLYFVGHVKGEITKL